MGEKTSYLRKERRKMDRLEQPKRDIYIYESHSTPHQTRREGKREKEKYIKKKQRKTNKERERLWNRYHSRLCVSLYVYCGPPSAPQGLLHVMYKLLHTIHISK